MANITFYLKSSKADKKGLKQILIQITHNYKRVRLSSGEKIKPAFWNKKKQRAFENKDFANDVEYLRINKFLDEVEAKFKTIVSNAKLNDIELSEAFFKNNLFKAEVKGRKTFHQAFDEYIETSKPNRATGTIGVYRTVQNFIKDFENDTKYTIDIGAIDLIFFDKLKEYSYNKRNTLDNYFHKITKVLRSFLNWAKDRDYYHNDIHLKFKSPERSNEVIYLTIDELMRLFKHKFESNIHEIARDLYCFGCFTGLRVSDILQLTKDNIKGDTILKTIQKTKKVETIPLNSFAKQILAKYSYLSLKPLPSLSEGKLNEQIKTCCELAKINDEIMIIKYSGNKKIEETKPKHKLITSHTARKTFVTNSLILGMNTKTIKSITGHRHDSSFERYLKIAEDYKKIEMENTWNQIGQPKKKVAKKTA